VQGSRAMLASPRWAESVVVPCRSYERWREMAQHSPVLRRPAGLFAGAQFQSHRQLAPRLLTLAHTACGNESTATRSADPPFILAVDALCAPSPVRHSCLPLLRGGPITARTVGGVSWRRLAPQPNQDPLLEKARHRSSFACGPALRSANAKMPTRSRRSLESRKISESRRSASGPSTQ
jgi:hypothetical protein